MPYFKIIPRDFIDAKFRDPSPFTCRVEIHDKIERLISGNPTYDAKLFKSVKLAIMETIVGSLLSSSTLKYITDLDIPNDYGCSGIVSVKFDGPTSATICSLATTKEPVKYIIHNRKMH